jgi:hypothetical protein
VIAILDAAERVRQRLLLASAMEGEQRRQQLRRLADELWRLGQALCDLALNREVSRFGGALALMAEAFRNSDPESGDGVTMSSKRRPGAWRAILTRLAMLYFGLVASPGRIRRMTRRCWMSSSFAISTESASRASKARRCRGDGGEASRGLSHAECAMITTGNAEGITVTAYL